MADVDRTVSWIQRQYFQAIAMKYFDWESLKKPKTIEQEIILKATCLHSLSQKYPPSNSYKLSFLKTLLAIYEEQEREICDEIYCCITDIMVKKQNQEDNFNYKSYILPCGKAITLCESSQFISQGTTGLNSWQAGKFLSNWIIQNKDIISGKRVLELGCGVGLSGLVALHHCRPKTYFFTDCHEKVLEKIQENLEINGFVRAECKQVLNTTQARDTNELNSRQCNEGIQDICFSTGSENFMEHETRQDIGCPGCFEECFSNHKIFRNFPPYGNAEGKDCETCRADQESIGKSSTQAAACHLDWQNCTFEQTKQYSPDVILGADIIFDPHVIGTLVNVIKMFLSIGRPKATAFIASTVRNKETHEKFILSLDSSGIKKSLVTDIPEKVIFNNTTSEILLLKLEL